MSRRRTAPRRSPGQCQGPHRRTRPRRAAGYGIDKRVIELGPKRPPMRRRQLARVLKIIQAAGIAVLPEKKDFSRRRSRSKSAGRDGDDVVPRRAVQITCPSAARRAGSRSFIHRSHAEDVGKGPGARADILFFFSRRSEYLIRTPSSRAARLENAVVIPRRRVLTTEPLRYPEGIRPSQDAGHRRDLSLLGKPIRGHVHCRARRPRRNAGTGAENRGAEQPTDPRAADVRPRRRGRMRRSRCRRRGRDGHEELMKFLPHRRRSCWWTEF